MILRTALVIVSAIHGSGAANFENSYLGEIAFS